MGRESEEARWIMMGLIGQMGGIDEQVYHDADYITPQDATRINNYYTPRCNLKDPCK